MKEVKFCKKCSIRLNEGFLNGMFGGQEYYTFEEGYYCPRCAKIKVDKARSKKEGK